MEDGFSFAAAMLLFYERFTGVTIIVSLLAGAEFSYETCFWLAFDLMLDWTIEEIAEALLGDYFLAKFVTVALVLRT